MTWQHKTPGQPWYLLVVPYRRLSARLQYLQREHTEDTAVFSKLSIGYSSLSSGRAKNKLSKSKSWKLYQAKTMSVISNNFADNHK